MTKITFDQYRNAQKLKQKIERFYFSNKIIHHILFFFLVKPYFSHYQKAYIRLCACRRDERKIKHLLKIPTQKSMTNQRGLVIKELGRD